MKDVIRASVNSEIISSEEVFILKLKFDVCSIDVLPFGIEFIVKMI